MTLKTILRVAEKFVTDNSPGILTGLAVAGTVTTAVFAGRAAYSSALKIHFEDERRVGDGEGYMDSRQKVELVWKEFVPTLIAGSASITCIIAANHIGTRRTAAIAAAFKISEQLGEEYRDRVVNTLGKQKEEKMRSELAGERIARTGGAETIIISGSEAMFYDEMSGRFFKGEMENVRKAVNDINYKVNNYYSASLSDFYELIGLSRTPFSDSVGWNTDELLEVQYTATLMAEGKPAISISFNNVPIRGFDRCQ
jgi:hypothetical protein